MSQRPTESEVKVTALLKEKLNPTYLAVEDVSCEPMRNITSFTHWWACQAATSVFESLQRPSNLNTCFCPILIHEEGMDSFCVPKHRYPLLRVFTVVLVCYRWLWDIIHHPHRLGAVQRKESSTAAPNGQ